MPRQNTGPRLVFYKRKGCKRPLYYIRWYEAGQEFERATGCGERDGAKAQDRLKDFIASCVETPDGPSDPSQMTCATMLAIYGQEHAPHTADPARIGYAIDALLPFWGDRPVSDIKGETARLYVKKRGRASATARRELGTLNAAGNYCLSEGYLTSFRPAALPPKGRRRERWITKGEAATLLRAARKHPRARWHLPLAILLYLYTGARKDAVLSLQWQPNTAGGHVDLDKGFIDFNPLSKAETIKRRARIPIPRKLRVLLGYARKRTRQYVVEFEGARVLSIRRAFGTACLNAGLSESKKVKGKVVLRPAIVPHQLKHSLVTWLLQDGVPLRDVAQWTATSEETLQRVYGHHSPEHLSKVRAALGG